jgi:hypothetical protein
MSKIKKEELEKLQGVVKELNKIQSQLGSIELQKHGLLHESAGLQDGLKKLQDELEEEYGQVTINLEDGSYTEITEENESDKKD